MMLNYFPILTIIDQITNNMQIVIATNDNVDKAMAEFCEKLKAISLTDEQKIFGKKILSLVVLKLLHIKK